MANIISNEKRHHQDKKKHLLLHSQLSAIKSQIKKTRITKSKDELNKSFRMIDSGISKGVLTKNKGNRWKSKLTLFVNDITKKHIIKDIKKKKPTSKKFDKNTKKNVKLSNSQIKKIALKKESLIKKNIEQNKIKNQVKEKKASINVELNKNNLSTKIDKHIIQISNPTKKNVVVSKPVIVSAKSASTKKPITAKSVTKKTVVVSKPVIVEKIATIEKLVGVVNKSVSIKNSAIEKKVIIAKPSITKKAVAVKKLVSKK